MKRLLITAVLFVTLQGAFAQTLLDSLQGNWKVTKITTNNKNSMQAGTLSFTDDGKFVSTGNHFGSANALYTTNETTKTVQIELADKKVTEWEVIIKGGVMLLTSVDTSKKGKEPVVRITAIRSRS